MEERGGRRNAENCEVEGRSSFWTKENLKKSRYKS